MAVPPSRQRPALPAGFVRTRLLRELEPGNGATPPGFGGTALVVAPPGFGKTTLLAQYIAGREDRIVWLRAGVQHRSAAGLYTALRRALQLGPATGPAPHIDLLSVFDELPPGPVILVVDDLHHLAGSEGELLLEELVVDAPPGLSLLIGSRRMPGWNMSRHEMAGVHVIDADQLRFRTWEVERLLRDVYHEPLPPEDVAALTRRTGGWAAGLHLFHLSSRNQPTEVRRRAVANLDGRSTLSRTYLTRTVLGDLPDELRTFLVRTCVFDTVTPHRCDRLLGATDSRARLEELERRQAFTVSHDGGASYVYHQVMRDYLEASLVEELGEAAARQWYSAAADLLAEEGASVEAARASARAGDWDSVHAILRRSGAQLAAQEVEPWQDLLPNWFVSDEPWLILADARHRLSRGHLEQAVDIYRHAETLFSDEHGRALCRGERRAAAVWLREDPAGTTHWAAPLRLATRHNPERVATEAIERGGPGNLLVAAVAALLAGNITRCRRLLPELTTDHQSAIGLAGRLVTAVCQVTDGAAQAPATLSALITDAERSRLFWIARLARALRAVVAGDGVAEVRRVAAECANDADDWGEALCLTLAAVAELADGAATVEALDELAERWHRLDAPVPETWARTMLAMVATDRELPAAAEIAHRVDAAARAAGLPAAHALLQSRLGRHQPPPPPPAPSTVVEAERTAATTAGNGSPRRVPLEVVCFGGFRISVDGQAVDWSAVRPKARAVMRLLAMHAGHPVHRETLAEALWPEADPSSAMRNLQVALSSLRTVLEPGAPRGRSTLIQRSGEAYLLAIPDGGHCDVQVFRSSIARARQAKLDGDPTAAHDLLRRALNAYSGELLPEDGPAEWVVSERESLRHDAAEAAAELAAGELARGQALAAVAATERCVQIDPCHDAGWRVMIDAYERADNLAGAERARLRYASMLQSLGLD